MDATLRSRAEQLAQDIATQATTVDDLNGLLRQVMKSALKRMLHSELDHHLKTPPTPPAEAGQGTTLPMPNRRNGTSRKTVQGTLGPIPSTAHATATGPSSRNASPSTSGGSEASTRRSWPSTPRA
jgi:hypothetical protein